MSHSPNQNLSPSHGISSPTNQQQQQQMQQLQMETTERPPSFRHSRAFRNFKNPPQPHMCIRDTTIDGHELFINVLSWTRIVMPMNPYDPIPLYGGMRVLPGSPRSPPLVYAVMANPDVLKETGRNCADDQERMLLVELMCDFVEAMNPGLKLSRKPEVLKDRDLSGELKDVWSAVQAKRDSEREREATYYEQLATAGTSESNLVVYTELGPESAPSYSQSIQQQQLNRNSVPESSQSAITKIEQQPTPLTPEKIKTEREISVDRKIDSKQKVEENKLFSSSVNEDAQNLVDVENVAPSPSSVQSLPSVTTPICLDITANKSKGNAAAVTGSGKKEKTLGGFLPNGCHSFFSKRKDKNNVKGSAKETKEKELKEKEVRDKDQHRSNSFKSKSNKSSSNQDTTSEGNIIKSLESDMSTMDLNRLNNEKDLILIKDDAFCDIAQSVKATTTAK